MRKSGVLLPVSSLPNKYGIGCFSKEAYDWVDNLKLGGQTYWQILPLGPTGLGDSPYQSFSTYAGNPYFIDLEEFITMGYITHQECLEASPQGVGQYIDYGALFETRFTLLRSVFNQVNLDRLEGYEAFCEEHYWWLDNYALYMSIKDFYGGASFTEWNEGLAHKDDKLITLAKRGLEDEVHFYKYLQFMFYKQWGALKAYANELGVKIIGDVPIYVAFDSADTWGEPELFQLQQNSLPIAVAGCPPDGFSPTGQLWGNPLYNWEYHKDTNYEWWVKRIAHCYKLYDIVRIDHFRGFDEYYSIPYGSLDAVDGQWKKGPGYELFAVLKEQLGHVPIIAENLGFLTPSVIELLEETTYPGMKILEFAFDAREESNYLPHYYEKNSVVYTGTHDNDTVVGWFESISQEDRICAQEYMGIDELTISNVSESMIRLAMSSVADTCIIPIQDYLGLGSEARMNIPSTLGMNWRWKLLPEQVSDDIIECIEKYTRIYGRK